MGATGTTGATGATGPATAVITDADGLCYFGYTSATACTLSPQGGGGLFINGTMYTVPSAGVALSNSGLGNSTLYYVYASISGGSMVLTASATGYVVDGYGRKYMSNGASTPAPVLTSRLVGMVYTTSAGKFEFDGTLLGVSSAFNRRRQAPTLAVNASTGATSGFAQVGGKISFLAWSEDVILNLGFEGYMAGSSGTTAHAAITIDGPVTGADRQGYFAVASAQVPLDIRSPVAVTDGIHSTYLVGQVSSGTTTYVGNTKVEVLA